MNDIVLITGGTGLLGSALTNALLHSGYIVRHLSRNPKHSASVKSYFWNPDEETMDETALSGVNYIINLAGENVGSGIWTESRKKRIVNSRVKGIRTIAAALQYADIKPKLFISASATGYYGSIRRQNPYIESDPPGADFLALVCRAWEDETIQLRELGIPLLICRFGILFSKSGGAFEKLTTPIKFTGGVIIGSGKQILPWVHIQDVVKAIQFGITHHLEGVYNITAPEYADLNTFVRLSAEKIKRWVSPIAIPAWGIKAILGEQSEMILEGAAVSSQKLCNEGFRFSYSNLDCALNELLEE
jgi:uncharacterized protein (TIGR01777 family)